MHTCTPPRSVLETAANTVVEYALHALDPGFLLWTKDLNMEVAEFIWNVGAENVDPSVFHAPGGDLSTLARHLCEARRAVPAEFDDAWLLELDVHHLCGEIFFTFVISLDDGETFHPCEISVDGFGPGPDDPDP